MILGQNALNRSTVPIPTVSTSASSYGAFLGLSGNLRYQLVNGAERLMQDQFQHLGVVIFFSTALRYFNVPTSECHLKWISSGGDDTNFLSPVFYGNQPCLK